MTDAPAFSIVDWESCNEDGLQESSVTEQTWKRSAHPKHPWSPQPGVYSNSSKALLFRHGACEVRSNLQGNYSCNSDPHYLYDLRAKPSKVWSSGNGTLKQKLIKAICNGRLECRSKATCRGDTNAGATYNYYLGNIWVLGWKLKC